MKYLLIDTSVYESEGFNFNQGYLKIIEDLCKSGDLKILTHLIIEGEVKSHITERVNTFKAGVKGLIKLSNIFYNNASYKILKSFDEKWYDTNALLSYKKFLEESKPIELKNENINIDDIVDDYIKKEPPFGNGKKKNEFPDAVILNALLKFKIKEDDKIYLASLDDDWIRFAEKHSIPCYSTIYSFMSEVMSENEQNLIYTDALKKWLSKNKNTDRVISILIEELDKLIEKKHDNFDDIDHQSSIKELIDVECIYFNMAKKEFSFQATFDCDIKYLLSYYDYDNASYDKEDGKYYNVEYVNRQYEDSTMGVAVIVVKFDRKDKYISIEEIDGIDIFQLAKDDFEFTTLAPEWDYDDYPI